MGYRLAIADDERLIRESLAQFISWEELGFELVLTAEDGTAVIEELKRGRLDAVLCDIQMQEKSGLDVAEFVWEQGLECVVVLLSGYEEFEYARKAISYNVSEYLLKPINLGKISEVFRRVRKELDERMRRKKDWEQFRKKEELFRHTAIEHMLEKAMMGVRYEPEACAEYLRKCGMSYEIMESPSYLMSVYMGTSEEYQTFGQEILRNILKLLAEPEIVEDIFMIYGKKENECGALLLCKSSLGKQREEEWLTRVSEAIHDIYGARAETAFEIRGVSLREMFEELGNRFLSEEQDTKSSDKAAWIDMIARQYLMILNMCSDSAEAEECIELISRQPENGLNVQECQDRILECMYVFLREQFPEKYLPPKEELLENRFQENMRRYYRWLHDNDNERESLADRIGRMVKERMSQNVTLSEAAQSVFLSPNYFSRIFKEQTGETFSEYCIRVKMEKAAEMMRNPGKKVYEIGEELGYHNIKYFYKLFKRTYHCTPLEYRRACHIENEE